MGLMSAIGGFFAGDGGRPRDPGDQFWWTPDPSGDGDQIVVSYKTVLQLPEVYACLTVLSESVASLPLVTFKRKEGGEKERADNHPVAGLLHDQPNDFDTAYTWRRQMTWDAALHRNAFSEIKPGLKGPIGSLQRIDPLLVDVVKLEDGAIVYDVADVPGRVRRLDASQVFHLKVPPLDSDGKMGRPIITDSWHIFSHALAVQDFGRRFFENGATPGGFLTSPEFKTPEQRKDWAQKWQRFFSGKKRFRIAVLDGGADYKQAHIANDAAQFNETALSMSLKLLRLWHMPPHKVGILDTSNRSTTEQQALEYVTDCLMPWLVLWEQAILKDLMLRRGFFAEHNVAGLLRGDLKSRYEAYAIGRQWGFLSANDIRKKENENSIGPAGDTYLEPMNMVPAGTPADQRGQNKSDPAPPGRNNKPGANGHAVDVTALIEEVNGNSHEI
jgi:HK97 family phage portal protein